MNELPNPHPANPAELAEELAEGADSSADATELSDEDIEARGVPRRPGIDGGVEDG